MRKSGDLRRIEAESAIGMLKAVGIVCVKLSYNQEEEGKEERCR